MSKHFEIAKGIVRKQAKDLLGDSFQATPAVTFTIGDIKAANVNDEFPGLDAICRKVFDVPFSDATPNLREHVRIIAKRDASEKMYDTLRTNITFVPCSCVSIEIHRPQCPRGQFIEAIMEAEGRKVPVVKSGS